MINFNAKHYVVELYLTHLHDMTQDGVRWALIEHKYVYVIIRSTN